MARPTVFTDALADAICEQLIGGLSLRKICIRAGMPSASTVCRWLADPANTVFREQYARAREAQADTLADETLFHADQTRVGTTTITKRVTIDGVETEEVTTRTGDMLGHRKLQVDTRKWLAGKLRPKKYGDRLELAGEVGVKRVSAEPLSEDEWMARHAPK